MNNTNYTSFLKLIVFNVVIAAVFLYLYSTNLLAVAWENDALYIMPTITVCFLVAVASLVINKAPTAWTDYLSEMCVTLGFIGTLYGIILSFDVDTGSLVDANSAGQMVKQVLHGIGVAVWTTMWGVWHRSWLEGIVSLMVGETHDTTKTAG